MMHKNAMSIKVGTKRWYFQTGTPTLNNEYALGKKENPEFRAS